jgi:hypothetical protein
MLTDHCSLKLLASSRDPCLQWINQSKYCILDNGQDEEYSEIGALREGVSVY